MGIQSVGRVAFLPWVRLAEPLTVYGVEFLPWRRSGVELPVFEAVLKDASLSGSAPSGDGGAVEEALGREELEVVERQLSPFTDYAGPRIEAATLAQREGSRGLFDWPDSEIPRFFRARDIVATAALADRYHVGPDSYVNSDHFWPIVQGFESGNGGSLLSVRTRHGIASIRILEDSYRVPAQLHASPVVEAHVNVDLAGVLADVVTRGDLAPADSRESELAGSLMGAMGLYLLANTDGSAYRSHTEMLLSVCALQQALGAAEKSVWSEIVTVFEETLEVVERPRTQAYACARAGSNAYIDAQRPSISQSLRSYSHRGLWLADAYWRRNPIAHGDLDGVAAQRAHRPAALWSDDEHLFLSAWIIPLVLHARCLRETGSMRGVGELSRRLRMFDRFLNEPELLGASTNEPTIQNWRRICRDFDLDEARERLLANTTGVRDA